jgi:Lateral organ boundaries (LOB) domain
MASPCAACKFLRRKCTNGCVFAPYFPPEQPSKFANVHKVFGASNVAKLLNELPTHQREEAVNSLSFEANARINNPVLGCVAYIQCLQLKIKEVQDKLNSAMEELSTYNGSSVCSPFHPQPPLITQNSLSAVTPASYMAGPFGLTNVGIGADLGLGSSAAMSSHSGVLCRDQVEAQQQLLAMETLREKDMLRFNATIEGMRGSYDGRFNTNLGHLTTSNQGAVELVSPQHPQIQHQHQNPQPPAQQHVFDSIFLARPPPQQQVHLQTQQQTQPQVQPQLQFYMEQMKQQQQHIRRVGSDEGRSSIRPSLP